jgi:hypothetical protein
MDVVTVEWRNESAMEELYRCVRYLVAALFDRLDRVRAPLDIVTAGDQRSQLARTLQKLFGELIEQLEEASFARHQSPEHKSLLISCGRSCRRSSKTRILSVSDDPYETIGLTYTSALF